MFGRNARRTSSLRLVSRLMAVAAIPLLLLGTMAPVAVQSASNGVIVHPAVTARATKDNLSSFPTLRPSQVDPTRVVPEGIAESRTTGPAPSVQTAPDPVLQSSVGDATDNHGLLSSPIQNFPGIATGFTPRDPTGDVGPTQYVQMVNTSFQVFNKTGGSVAGPFAISQIWVNAGDTGECSNTNDGDPIVLYDHLADRWLLSQFDATGPNFAECVAISQTPNAAGLYYAYRFPIPAAQGTFPDYPHFGVWPDGYYLSTFEGTLGAYVFERSMMLTGNPARTIEYPKQSALGSPAGFRSSRMLPSDLDGPAPPAGSPNFFLRPGEDVQGVTDRLDIFEATVNWGDPLTSSFTNVQTIATAPYNYHSCPNDAGVPPAPRLCIDQPNTAQTLDALMGRPMYRLQYRNFGSHETLVVNQTVDADPGAGGNTGIRWYEIRRTPPGAGAWAINQQGTYAPQAGGVDDTTWVQRWMGSAAMDRAGNIALAYNVVNDDDANPIYPGIRYTGRVAGDPSGILPQGEETIIDGQSPSTANRWGDYTHLSVDPADDCTFWYTAEWIDTGNARRTRIASFNFPSCSATDIAITKSDSPDPIAAGNILTYTVNVSNAGPSTATNVVVTDLLPAGVTYLSNSDGCVEAPVGTLTCSLGTLTGGANTSFTIQVRVPADYLAAGPPNLINTATVAADQADSNPGNNTATATTQVIEQADLRLLKECKPDQPNAQPAGTSTFCDIYVDNLGPSAARDVVITDTIISSTPITIISIASSTTSGAAAVCLPAPPIGPTTTTTITCNDDSLPAGARDTIRVTFQALDPGDVDDTATVSSATPDPDTGNNSATGRVSFRAASDLALTKTDDPDPVTAGTNLTYTIQVANNGPSAAANVVVTDSLPVQVSFVSSSPSQGSCQAGVVPGDPAKPLKCNLGTLPGTGVIATITVIVKVNSDVPTGTILVNNAEVASDSADPDTSDNIQTVTTTVNTNADLAITKTSDASTYKPSTQVKYQITVVNIGPSKALNVVVTDFLPDLKAAIYNSDTAGCVKSAPRILVCNLGDMAVSESKTFFIYVTIRGSKGNVSNTATVVSATPDAVGANNSSTRVVTIKGKP